MRHLSWCLSFRLALALTGSMAPVLKGADCNQNGIDDALDLASRLDFLPPSRVPLEGRPIFVTAGGPRAPLDLNRDGLVDLAVADYWEGGISVLIGTGNGDFQLAFSALAGSSPREIAPGDIDADGLEDLVVVDPSYSGAGSGISILLNRGGLDLEAGEHLSAGARPASVVPGDHDRDGDLDLAMATLNGVVSVWRNDGDGSFSRRLQFEVGGMAQGLTGADLDADGDLDLASADAGISMLRNRGDGTFDEAVSLRSEIAYAYFVASADLDGDGAIDLLSVGEGIGRTLSILWNGGDAAFPEGAAFQIGRNLSRAAIVDLDGGGDLDIVGADYGSESMPVLVNGGRRRFTAAQDLAAGGITTSAAAGDLDGDGVPDLAFNLPDAHGVGIVLNRSAPSASRDNDLDGIPDECEGTVFRRGDASADGSMDLVDAIFLIFRLFEGGSAPPCRKSADADDDGALVVPDVLFILRFLFLGGKEPGAPFHSCGGDPSADGLDCESFPPCRRG